MPSDAESRNATEFEYRIVGCTAHGWRRTEWSDREDAVEVYGKADWAMIGFERREVGDDKTIQRKPKPSLDEWNDVTEEDTHFADEEVKANA